MSGLNAQALYQHRDKKILMPWPSSLVKKLILWVTPRAGLMPPLPLLLVAILTPPLPSPLVDTCYEHENLLAYCRRSGQTNDTYGTVS